MAIKYVTSNAAGGGDGSIGSPYTLAEAAANCSGNTMILAPGTYTLGADFIVSANSAWQHSGAAGDVIIDGEAGATDYTVIIRNCTATFTGLSGKVIKFYRGSGVAGTPGVAVYGSTALTTVTFNYCMFANAQVNNGLTLKSDLSAYKTIVTCNNCIATANNADGFSIDGTTNYLTIEKWLYLNDCNSYANGSGTAHNSATAHATKQYLVINGGNYYGEAGPAIAVVGNCILFLSNANVYNCNTNIVIEGTVFAVIENCVFSVVQAGSYHIVQTSTGFVAIRNCQFLNTTAASHTAGIYCNGGLTDIRNNVFANLKSGQADIWAGSGSAGVNIINNTFYNGFRGVNLNNRNVVVNNNIFHTYSSFVIMNMLTLTYQNNKLNGYNLFYLATTWYDDGTGLLDSFPQPTDLYNINPQFANAAGGDFRPTNPAVLRGGVPDIVGNPTQIGAIHSKHQFISKARVANYGRLSIFK